MKHPKRRAQQFNLLGKVCDYFFAKIRQRGGGVPTRVNLRSERSRRSRQYTPTLAIAGPEVLPQEELPVEIEERSVDKSLTLDPLTYPQYQPRVMVETMPAVHGQQPVERRSRFGRVLKAPQRFVSYFRAAFDTSDSDSD